ncbi:MAG: hypothetical protein IKQ40_07675 [Lachnospiraceae bacterium]|nr:hypothetical protein [Lachnospiraceae bacterium]
MSDNKKKIREENMENVTGGIVTLNPGGSSATEDKYLIRDDETGQVLGTTGGYRTERKMAEMMGQSPELK